METIEIERCTVCNSSLVDDTENGEIICSGCGIVMAGTYGRSGSRSKKQ